MAKTVMPDANRMPPVSKSVELLANQRNILVVDDFKDWRKQVRSLLQGRPELQIVCEVSDGLEAVQKAQELKPDLIVLDIGLPKLSGIEAVRRIQDVSPNSKVVFLTMDNSQDTEQVALSTGAQGFVHKARAQSELLPAIDAVLRGEQFVSNKLGGTREIVNQLRMTGSRATG